MNKINASHISELYIQKLLQKGIRVESAYLFGSYVKPKAHNDYSDIDIGIVSPDFGKDRIEERVMLMRLSEGVSDLIEPHPISSEEMSNVYIPFIQEIKRTGKRIL